MEKPERRSKVSLAGLGLVSAGAMLGLALAAPASAPVNPAPPKPDATPAAERN